METSSLKQTTDSQHAGRNNLAASNNLGECQPQAVAKSNPDAGNKFAAEDQRYLGRRRELSATIEVGNLFEIADHFGLYAGEQTIGRGLAIYEIVKQSLDAPGDIFEFGCWQGSNLLMMAKILKLLQPNSLRQIYGFDSFAGLQTFSDEDGASTREQFADRYCGNEHRLRQFIELHQMENWVHLVVGDALQTIDAFEESNQHSMISLAYIDFDLYAPCARALEFSHHRLSSGGLIVLDEALTETWKGEGQALREFLARYPGQYKMQSNGISRQPTVILRRC